jgi:hypothetical protein
MNMKTKIFLAGLLLALLGSSCSEDFLEIPSQSALSTPIYYQTEADFQAAVNGIYSLIRIWNKDVTTPALMIGDMHSDNSRYYLNPSFRAGITEEGAADFVPNPQLFSGYWSSFYQWISNANQVISRIDNVDMDADVKDNLKGQALFLRGYAYWWLARLYGNAVIHTEPVTTLEETSKELSSEAEVIAQIIEDASEAAVLLLSKATQEPGRVTSGSAQMLLADVYMYQGEWASAETALNSLMGDYSLVMTSYADVFDPMNKNNSESIFEIQYDASSSSYSSDFGYRMFPYPFASDSLQAMTGISNPQDLAEGEGYFIPTPELIAAYEAGDARLAATIKNVTDLNGVALPMCIKYVHAHSLYRQSNDNLPVYRYAEALLFMAEAINEQGGRSGEALGYLNQVRSRAGLGDSPALTQEEIRAAILQERQVELAMEGKRWFDLVRTGNVSSVIAAYGANVVANPQDYYFPEGYGTVPSAFTDTREKFEIPDSEVLYNTEVE